MAKSRFFETVKASIDQIVSGSDSSTYTHKVSASKSNAHDEVEAAIIVLCAELMRVNGNNTTETETILTEFLERNFSKAPSKKRKEKLQEHIKLGAQPYIKLACQALKTLTTYSSREEILVLLYSIAAHAHAINATETKTIARMAKLLEIEDEKALTIKARFANVHSPFTLLGIEETTSLAVVKKAYRKMTLKYHPDKRRDGVSAEEANRKFREIQKAYLSILEGWQ